MTKEEFINQQQQKDQQYVKELREKYQKAEKASANQWYLFSKMGMVLKANKPKED